MAMNGRQCDVERETRGLLTLISEASKMTGKAEREDGTRLGKDEPVDKASARPRVGCLGCDWA